MGSIRENRYLVLKTNDIMHLSLTDRNIFQAILDEIEAVRASQGKTENTYVVINADEPYADKVWQLIEGNE